MQNHKVQYKLCSFTYNWHGTTVITACSITTTRTAIWTRLGVRTFDISFLFYSNHGQLFGINGNRYWYLVVMFTCSYHWKFEESSKACTSSNVTMIATGTTMLPITTAHSLQNQSTKCSLLSSVDSSIVCFYLFRQYLMRELI